MTKCRCVHGFPWFFVCDQCLLDRWGDQRTIDRALTWDGDRHITPTLIELERMTASRNMWRAQAWSTILHSPRQPLGVVVTGS